MKLELTDEQLPVRINFELADGGRGHSYVVYQYADGKVLTVSALVLDPSGWVSAELRGTRHGRLLSPPWANKSSDEVMAYYNEKTTTWWPGKVVSDVAAPISESAEEIEIREGSDERVRQASVMPIPKTIRRVTAKDEVSDEEFLGEKETA